MELTSGAGSTDGTPGALKAEMNAAGRGHAAHNSVTDPAAYSVTSRRSESATSMRCTATSSAPGAAAPGAESVSAKVTARGAAGVAEGLAPCEIVAVGVDAAEGVSESVGAGEGVRD